MSDELKLQIPPHVLAERNPARAFALLLEVPAWREVFASRQNVTPDEIEIDVETLEMWATFCEQPMTPEDMRRADETFDRIVDDFVLGQDELAG